jgi:hypothetical protein
MAGDRARVVVLRAFFRGFLARSRSRTAFPVVLTACLAGVTGLHGQGEAAGILLWPNEFAG